MFYSSDECLKAPLCYIQKCFVVDYLNSYVLSHILNRSEPSSFFYCMSANQVIVQPQSSHLRQSIVNKATSTCWCPVAVSFDWL